ncbi:hypothetical protein KKP89_01100, partial [Methanothermococcus sp. SCGC AD-155-N22]|nr:hypothetical protein [Methanothermococcus sp. SCGC AD-155-N22]
MRNNLLYILLLIFSIGTLSTVSASSWNTVSTTSSIIWNATISAEKQLEPVIVGTHPNATDGYDEEFDEYTQNPEQGKVIMALDGIYAKNIKRSVPPGSNVTWGLSVGVPSGTTTTLN